ncbi:MAG: hypothetical protein WBQ32_01760, partial [Ignavibacteriaceae bacterium]
MMLDQDNKIYNIIDWIILSFFVIFILSLSNSIFINQIGYFGALLFILLKIFLTRKNQFQKTGLEFAFALYMIAEILSLIFSDYKAEALQNFSKRALLIPVFYTTITVTTSLKRGKNFFSVFIIASLITSLVYLVVSVKYYLNNQYVITQSGPDLIQNPITTSEIVSFTILFLFAFILNEKTRFRTKLLLYAGFGISLLALIATYKRTGWMGVVFGIILLLVIKRRWGVLLPIIIVGLFFLITDKNISQVNVYDFESSKLSKLFSFNTDGRAWNVAPADSYMVISDYENGLLFYQDSTLVEQIKTPEPVVSFLQIKDNLYLTQLVDTRFLISKRDDKNFKYVDEILPPGQTKNFVYSDENLYTLDSDSGLTVFGPLQSSARPFRFPEIKGYKWLFIDSSYFYFVSELSGAMVYSNDGLMPGKMIFNKEIGETKRAYLFNSNLLISNPDGLRLFKVENNEIVLKDQLKNISNVNRMSSDAGILAVLCSDGNVYKLRISANSKFEMLARDKLSPVPTNFNFVNNKLYCTYIDRGRLLSFLDPYLVQNFTRLALWRAGWKMFLDHPLFGVGDIDLAKYYLQYKRPTD